jgi:hypothetical protein
MWHAVIAECKYFDTFLTVVERNIKMLRRKCVATENLKTEHMLLKENQQVGKVLCTICRSAFCI